MQYLLHKLFRVLLAVALVATALVFAAVLVVVALATVLLIGGWVWWRRRHLKRSRGVVIEGEFRVDDAPRHLSR
jgi:O-antigen/teichoic acid export membrane protein